MFMTSSLPRERGNAPRFLPVESCAERRARPRARRRAVLVPGRSVVPSCPNTEHTHHYLLTTDQG